ncbi:MAG: ABC-type heme export system permease component CcmB [Oceanicaulis sp. HLUCCA04]|nr:MAG: ABC-type heme export system permease component CcmB [Oceanicaulis sp. HLUCCA04]
MMALRILFLRELHLAVAGGGGAAGPAAFMLAALALVPLGVGPDPEILRAAAPGVVAFAALLASLQGAERMFGDDLADGTLELYALSPVSLTGLALAKAGAFALGVLWPAPVIGFVAALAYGMDVQSAGVLAAALLLAVPGLALGAGFAGALAAGLSRAGLLIALIAAPLQVPLLVFVAGAGRAAMEDTGLAGANLMLAGAFSLAALALAPFGMAAALKARLE